MKTVLLLFMLCALARADQYTFTLTGTVSSLNRVTSLVSLGNTFTAQFTVATAVTDSDSSAQVGTFHQTGFSMLQFSNGLNVSLPSFDYMIVDSLYHPGLGYSYDALAFYGEEYPGYMGFEIRFPENTFLSDQFVIPDNPISLASSNWFYLPPEQSGLRIGTTINSITVAAIPETASSVLWISFLVLLFVCSKRIQKNRIVL